MIRLPLTYAIQAYCQFIYCSAHDCCELESYFRLRARSRLVVYASRSSAVFGSLSRAFAMCLILRAPSLMKQLLWIVILPALFLFARDKSQSG